MTLNKLKLAARGHEQREEWGAAIEAYRQLIRESEAAGEGSEPALFNRLGDVAQRAGETQTACEAWEQAANRYGEQGFFNNAIALGSKILRADPTRLRTHLDIARFHGRKRVLYEVREHLQTYHTRMNALGRGDAGRTAILQFGAEFPGWRDLEDFLDELLGRERTVRDTAEPMVAPSTPARNSLVFLDTGPLEIERASDARVEEAPSASSTAVVDFQVELTPEPAPLAGLEPTMARATTPPAETAPGITGLISIERTVGEVVEVERVSGMDTLTEVVASPADAIVIDGFEATSKPVEVPAATAEVAPGDSSNPPGLVYLDTSPDPLADRAVAEALIDGGERAAGVAALERAFASYLETGEWLHAYRVAGELIAAQPEDIARYQSRVEVATRLPDPALLREAYNDLGDALLRQGSREKAIAVYRRVLELEDTDVRARAALRAMAPETTREPAPEGFIDLGAELLDDAGPHTTRMRTETPTVADDEDETFRDALAEFKRALDQNLPVEDHQAHYDLGIAFKEMGLFEEAIGEFQKALRAPEGRLRTSEALGEVFLQQGRASVAEAVLRSVEKGPEGDADKIGVLYWLGSALEAQGKGREALGYFERVIAVDIGFRDASDRVTRLAGAPGS